MAGDAELRELGGRVEALLEELRGLGPEPFARVEALVQALVQLYGAGLGRMVELIKASPASDADLWAKVSAEPVLASLLCLHELHPVAFEQRIDQAIDELTVRLAAPLEVLRLGDDGVLELRVGAQPGCGSAAARATILRVMEGAAPELAGVVIAGLADQPVAGLIPAARLVRAAR